jgi:alpha-D-ribose 1-methylphosphonate 5-triphosphate synthase subunit PhnG
MADVGDMTRKDWMSLLARAPEALLMQLWQTAGIDVAHSWLRSPEIGAVMVRGRAGGTGAPFNLGEMTVTRCTLRLEGGQVGHAYVAGRSREKARIAALCDALLQDMLQADAVRDAVLSPLAEAAAEARRVLAAKAAATKVEFFTMARKRV